ncbi:MAG: hypothetical protein N2663_03190 [Chlorobi bacterium]|nr:hypothetical protein [Chlorobiota bacterium]
MTTRTKKFVAPTLRQALDAMRRELGDDALLLATQSGVDPDGMAYAAVVGMATGQAAPQPNVITDAAGAPSFRHRPVRMDRPEPIPLRYYLESNTALTSDSAIERLHAEVHQLSAKLTEITHAVAYRYSAVLPDPYRSAYHLLRDAGFSEQHAGYLVSQIASGTPAPNLDECFHRLRRTFSELLRFDRIIAEQLPPLIAFAGPSGSGKTTTLMKVALLLRRAFPDRMVRIVSADTERIAATEQLRTFASIVKFDFDVATDLLNYPGAKNRPGITLLDLPPSSGRSAVKINIAIDTVASNHGILLNIIPATADRELVQQLLQKHAHRTNARFALTKLDEMPQCGHILPLFWEAQVPLSLVTTGTKLPDDISEPSVDQLMQYLFPTHRNSVATITE